MDLDGEDVPPLLVDAQEDKDLNDENDEVPPVRVPITIVTGKSLPQDT